MAIRVGTTNHDQGGIRSASNVHSSWNVSVDINLVRNEQSLNYLEYSLEIDGFLDLIRVEQSLHSFEYGIEFGNIFDLSRSEQVINYLEFSFGIGIHDLVRNEQSVNYLDYIIEIDNVFDLTRSEQIVDYLEFILDSDSLLNLVQTNQSINYFEQSFAFDCLVNLAINNQSIVYSGLAFESNIEFDLVRGEQGLNYFEYSLDLDGVFDLTRLEQSINYLEFDVVINEIDIDLVISQKNLITESLDIVSDQTIPFYTEIEEGDWWIVSTSYQLYITEIESGGTPPEEPLVLSITPDPFEVFTRYTELGTIPSYTLSANKTPITYDIVDGVLPQEMELVDDTLVGGTIEEMDLYVPAFAMPLGTTIQIDGSHYATYGSALAGGYQFETTIRGYYQGTLYTETSYVTFTVYVRNNYSSDRDKLIKDITETFGELGEDNEYRYFEIDGTRVTYQEYIDYQKANGYYS